MNYMNYLSMSKDEAYKWLDHMFNPPELGEGFTEDDFFKEWDAHFGQLRTILNRYGEEDKFEQKDYILHEFPSPSRDFGVNITSRKLIAASLISDLLTWLAIIAEDYQITLVIENPNLKGYVFITRNSIKAWCPSEVSKQFGFEVS